MWDIFISLLIPVTLSFCSSHMNPLILKKYEHSYTVYCTPSDTKSLGLCFVALNLPFHNWHIFGLHIKDPHRVSDRTKLDIIHVNLPSLFFPPSSVPPEFLAINGTWAYHRWSSIRMLGINLKLSVASREY